MDEFICAVAVMHRGTAAEQLRMLFEVCVRHICVCVIVAGDGFGDR